MSFCKKNMSSAALKVILFYFEMDLDKSNLKVITDPISALFPNPSLKGTYHAPTR